MKNYRIYRFNPITKQWIPAETFSTPEEAEKVAQEQCDLMNDANWTGAKYRKGTMWRVYYAPSLKIMSEIQ